MTHTKIREKFLKFFESKGHTIVPSSSLLPTDPSVLFTTAGMQQFKPYYTGEADPQKDFGGLDAASIQKCFRTSDIDEVGDESHLTFFEMLGNFSFGGYFKKPAIEWAYEFITREMNLEIDYVSTFAGEDGLPADAEAEEIWRLVDPNVKIKKLGKKDNFWGPTGDEGPCGPTTEIYVDGIEIWNLVFNQYYKTREGKLDGLKMPGIDTGMGLERLARVVQKKNNIFETDLFESIFKALPEELNIRQKRIISDHIRGISFLISDGVLPSNKDQGYVLRRLMRRVMVQKHILGKEINFTNLFKTIGSTYGIFYADISENVISDEFSKEKDRFSKSLKAGLKELGKMDVIDNSEAFKLYESYGLPFEVIKEIGGRRAEALTRSGFEEEFKRHQEKSRAGAEKKFGGHGLILNTGELKAADEEELKKVTRLHTATHMLQAALRQVLGTQVHQAGSDITAERLRFDFTFSRKLTPEEIKEIESTVNRAIQQNLLVRYEEMPLEDAKKSGALYFVKEKYPDRVKVYTIGPEPVEGQDSSTSSKPPFSRELCGGPHVKTSGEVGKFRITKEEAVSAGVRRIRAVVE